MADRFPERGVFMRNARRDKISGHRILCTKDILSPGDTGFDSGRFIFFNFFLSYL